MRIFYWVCALFLTVQTSLASPEDANWLQFNLAFEPILSSTSSVHDLVGPGSTVGANDPYLMGGWKVGFNYDLSPNNQIGLGFKTIYGYNNFTFKDAGGNPDSLNTNTLGLFIEGRTGFQVLSHWEASLFADLGYEWLINSTFNAAPGGSSLAAGTPDLLLGAGTSLWLDPAGVFGIGLDVGYQFMKFSPVSAPQGELKNADGNRASMDMSGFVIEFYAAQVSLDLNPKPKPETYHDYPSSHVFGALPQFAGFALRVLFSFFRFLAQVFARFLTRFRCEENSHKRADSQAHKEVTDFRSGILCHGCSPLLAKLAHRIVRCKEGVTVYIAWRRADF